MGAEAVVSVVWLAWDMAMKMYQRYMYKAITGKP
ncbi:protein of unknown function [Sterolibacterium denitrificans]|uniref:Uncharacterized protein n=1 Tax=Sterolibacterium denitrificans TaxID=157592 RepID=A0A7Z7HQU7_9PROT|nr:protein of unknown function [Sterolibacterium denitrificans]